MIATVGASAIASALRSTSVALAIFFEAKGPTALATHLVSHRRRCRHDRRRHGGFSRLGVTVRPGALSGRRRWSPLWVFIVGTRSSGKLVRKGGWIPFENNASSFFNIRTVGSSVVTGLTAALWSASGGGAKALTIELQTLTLFARASSTVARLLGPFRLGSLILHRRFVIRT